MQLPSESLVECPVPQPSKPPLEEMGVSEVVLKRRAYHREWSRNHKDRTKAYHLRKYSKNKDRIKAKRSSPEYKAKMQAYLKKYRADHPEKIKELNRGWVDKNKARMKAYREAYGPRRRNLYEARKEEICARKQQLSKTFKYRTRVQDYCRNRRKNDPEFAMIGSLRASMNRAFRRNWIEKPARTEALLGCTISEAKSHIESQFAPGMSWENRPSFVIDHYVPIEIFDLRNSDEVSVAFCWKNLRPITRHENAVKSDTVPNPLPNWLPARIAERIRLRSGQ